MVLWNWDESNMWLGEMMIKGKFKEERWYINRCVIGIVYNVMEEYLLFNLNNSESVFYVLGTFKVLVLSRLFGWSIDLNTGVVKG